MLQFSADEFNGRVERLQKVLRDQGIDVAVVDQNADLYYYAGTVLPLYLIVPAEGAAFLMARKAGERIRNEVSHLPLELFVNSKNMAEIVGRRVGPVKKIGFAMDTMAHATVLRWQQLFPGATEVDFSWELRRVRMIKSEAETTILRKAGRIMAGLPAMLREQFRPSMTELDVTAAIEVYLRRNGHTGLVRCHRNEIEMNYGVCSAGVNSLAGTKFDGICAGVGTSPGVPYGAGRSVIPQNEPVILDYGFNYEGYHLDQTRMMCWGEPSYQVEKAYQAMLEVEDVIIKNLNPGATWSEIYEKALAKAVALGYEKEFMGLGPEKVKFVGHGIGVELDEPPFIAPGREERIEAGMLIAVEPKVSLPGVGVIGIEDTVAVYPDGPEYLTVCGKEWIRVG